jgi:rhamnose transport system substrate-binding protein
MNSSRSNKTQAFGRLLTGAACVLLLTACRNEGQNGTSPGGETAPGGNSTTQTLTVGVMPKLIGIDYFDAVQKGAEEAGKELGINVVYDGPTQGDSAKQSEMLDIWISRKFDVISISPNDPNAIAPVLDKARERGLSVITYDADAAPESRSYFVNQATNESIGAGLVEVLAEETGGQGEFAVLTGSMTAANQNAWIEAIRATIAAKHAGMKLPEVRPTENDPETAYRVTTDLLKAYPNLKGIFAITSIALPQAARAVKDAGMAGKVALTGLATPSAMKPYIEDGTVKTFLLWDPKDLGYLTVYTAKAVHDQKTLPSTIQAGRLKDIQVSGTEVLLGPPIRFDKSNIDKYDF